MFICIDKYFKYIDTYKAYLVNYCLMPIKRVFKGNVLGCEPV